MFKYLNKDESGQSLVLVALMMAVLLGFGALAIDIGYMTFQKSELQNAADAAALAGAGSIPIPGVTANDIRDTIVPDYVDDNINNLISLEVNPGADLISANVVEVTITQEIPKLLGGILSDKSEIMTVTARAEYTPGKEKKEQIVEKVTKEVPSTQWTGESLPFINVKQSGFNIGTEFEVWNKIANGYFECINNFEVLGSGSNLYFNVDIQKGLEIKNGVVASKKDELQTYYDYHKKQDVYIYSLSPTALSTQKVTMNYYDKKDGTKTQVVENLYDKHGDLAWKNKDGFVDISSLVLIRCTFQEYIDKGKDGKTLKLIPKKVYNIANNEWPEGYTNPDEDLIVEVVEDKITEIVTYEKPKIKLIQ